VVEFCKHSHNSSGFIDAEIFSLIVKLSRKDNVAVSYESEVHTFGTWTDFFKA